MPACHAKEIGIHAVQWCAHSISGVDKGSRDETLRLDSTFNYNRTPTITVLANCAYHFWFCFGKNIKFPMFNFPRYAVQQCFPSYLVSIKNKHNIRLLWARNFRHTFFNWMLSKQKNRCIALLQLMSTRPCDEVLWDLIKTYGQRLLSYHPANDD